MEAQNKKAKMVATNEVFRILQPCSECSVEMWRQIGSIAQQRSRVSELFRVQIWNLVNCHFCKCTVTKNLSPCIKTDPAMVGAYMYTCTVYVVYTVRIFN